MVPGTPESLARTVPIGHGSMTFLPLSLDPEPGTNRQVVLLIAVRNNGPLPANPDPFFALVGRTFDGQPAHTAPTARASDGDFPITQRIPVGQTLVGTVAFDIPGGAALGTISVLPLAPDALPLAVWNVSDLPHGVAPAPHRSSAGGDLHPTGGTATLHGKGFSKVPQPNDQPVDEMITVAMTAVVDPAEPADPDSVALDSGDRLVAVRFDVHNIGENTYSADGAVAVLAFDTLQEGYAPDTMLLDTTLHDSLPATVLPPGGQASGYLVFQIPRQDRLDRVQFALAAGGAPSLAQWRVD